jgi:hypothetical protein
MEQIIATTTDFMSSQIKETVDNLAQYVLTRNWLNDRNEIALVSEPILSSLRPRFLQDQCLR